MTLDVTRKDWWLVTSTRGGKVNFTRNLTLEEADKTAKAVNFYDNMTPGIMYEGSDSDIIQTTILGPDGWDGCRKAAQHDWSGLVVHEWHGKDRSHTHCKFGSCKNCGQNAWQPCDADGNVVETNGRHT